MATFPNECAQLSLGGLRGSLQQHAQLLSSARNGLLLHTATKRVFRVNEIDHAEVRSQMMDRMRTCGVVMGTEFDQDHTEER